MHAVYLPAFTALICVMLSCVQATLLLPYMTAMSLGRTFNAKHNKVGVDIFKREDMENAQVSVYFLRLINFIIFSKDFLRSIS